MSWAQGKVALVTGGSQGIGHATAAALLAAGADVIVTGTRASFGDYDQPLTGVRYIRADMKVVDDRIALANAINGLDILVNNAGGSSANEFAQDEFEAVIDLNLNSVMDLSMRLFPRLKASGGAIVNVGSLASFLAIKEGPAYTASKAGLLGLTRALADKWATDGVRVNLVAPGFIQTRMTARMRGNDDLEKRLLKAIPMRRWGQPREIAEAILFLASPAASYITGQSLAIDGGLLLR
jgi:3-oxoacyl-[acyl-carrier protein] reductase